MRATIGPITIWGAKGMILMAEKVMPILNEATKSEPAYAGC